jgi:hypothetical protein
MMMMIRRREGEKDRKSGKDYASHRDQTPDSRQQTADTRKQVQTADNRQYAIDSRQQTADSTQQTSPVAAGRAVQTSLAPWGCPVACIAPV